MLTTLANLKVRLGLQPYDTTEDAILQGIIDLCTGRFEAQANRKFARTADATFEFSADKTEIIPERYPIESVSTFHLKTTESDGWLLQSAVDYLINSGHVISLTAALGSERERARITYTAGYVLPGTDPAAGQTALPEELEQIALEQSAFWYRNKDRIGLSAVSAGGAAVSQNPISVVKPLDLLPTATAVLGRYKRMVL